MTSQCCCHFGTLSFAYAVVWFKIPPWEISLRILFKSDQVSEGFHSDATLYHFGSVWAPNLGLSPPMIVRKWAKFEEKSDFIRILMVPWALFTLWAPNRFEKVTCIGFSKKKDCNQIENVNECFHGVGIHGKYIPKCFKTKTNGENAE